MPAGNISDSMGSKSHLPKPSSLGTTLQTASGFTTFQSASDIVNRRKSNFNEIRNNMDRATTAQSTSLSEPASIFEGEITLRSQVFQD